MNNESFYTNTLAPLMRWLRATMTWHIIYALVTILTIATATQLPPIITLPPGVWISGVVFLIYASASLVLGNGLAYIRKTEHELNKLLALIAMILHCIVLIFSILYSLVNPLFILVVIVIQISFILAAHINEDEQFWTSEMQKIAFVPLLLWSAFYIGTS